MGVTGDFGKLDQLRARLRTIQRGGLTAELSQRLGETSMKLMADQYRGEHDPYGQAWEPLATKRRRGSKARARILRDTGRMAASGNFQVIANGLRIMIPVKYAPVHQNGATIHAHSNVRGQLLRLHPETGRFVRKGRAATLVRAKRATFGEVVIPRRQLLPTRETGGLGPIWGEAYNNAAGALLRRHLQEAA